MSQPSRFAGVLPPVLTPFDGDLAPDHGRFLAHCRWLLEEGAGGLGIFGTTSEANSLSLAERLGLLETLLEGGIAPQTLLVGSGACALPDAVELSARAAAAGAGGVLLLPPFYYKAVTDDGLFAFVAELIERVADSALKVYLYHIPPIAQVGYSIPLVEKLVAAYPETVVGLKDSSGDWGNTEALLKAVPQLAVFPGSESFLLKGLRAGAAGCITASANVNMRGIAALYDQWQSPEAERLQDGITLIRKAIQAKPLIPALKAILAAGLGDPDWARTRPPLEPLNAEEARALIAGLAAHDFKLAA